MLKLNPDILKDIIKDKVLAVVSTNDEQADMILIINRKQDNMDVECEIYPEGLNICYALGYESQHVYIQVFDDTVAFVMRSPIGLPYYNDSIGTETVESAYITW